MLGIIGCAKQEADITPKTAATESRDSVIVELAGVDSVTVFDLLKQTHEVDYLSTSGGVFVKGIDSVNNGTSTYWVYSVNDTNPKISADRMYTRAGDKVVWHFRKMKE
jgi:hypothetical protein